ncbi:hypothetical protein Patl1_13919 [Pistacia atlantica]|uniref:Uncharacterized protein n=1 Tax=Pistacia atlantica TaxID=434234 RepID=A0ACC1AXH1_9ROSI|nr:hypothetical protein Patl1_13919 [Pistacia atlantica]
MKPFVDTGFGVFRNYDHPFAVTYLETSLLVAYLPLAILKDLIRKFFRRPSSKSSNGSEPETVDIDRTSSRELDSRVHHGDLEAKPYGSPSNVKECAINIGVKEEFESKDNEETLEQEGKLSAKEVATFGFGIAPICCTVKNECGNYNIIVFNIRTFHSYNKCTYWPRQNQISHSNFRGNQHNWNHSLEGDVFAILSAMTYGLFSTCLNGGRQIDRAICLVFSLAFDCHGTIEPKFSFPKSAKMTRIILINGFVGNFLSDYFWAIGVVWTSPLVAAVGCFSYNPTSHGGRHAQHYSLLYIIGSVQVFLGFVVANLADWISGSPHVICADQLKYVIISAIECTTQC